MGWSIIYDVINFFFFAGGHFLMTAPANNIYYLFSFNFMSPPVVLNFTSSPPPFIEP